MSRSRWAAIGAAVAVSLGGGGLLPASATIGSGERPVFVSITPCRLTDTRAGSDNVGPRATPLGSGETLPVAVRGTNGKCTIPGDAVAVALNVATLNGTASSFLTLFPSDVDRPLTANLNWVAGAPPTPNKVDVRLGTDGAIKVYNLTGSVDVVIDVFGYYADHNHDDRYYTRVEIDSALSTKQVDIDDGSTVRSVGDTSPVVFPAFGSGGGNQFTLPRASRLFVTTAVRLDWKCVGNDDLGVWLDVDGTDIEPSFMELPFDPKAGDATTGVGLVTLVGVTPQVVPAGQRIVSVQTRCLAGAVATSLSLKRVSTVVQLVED